MCWPLMEQKKMVRNKYMESKAATNKLRKYSSLGVQPWKPPGSPNSPKGVTTVEENDVAWICTRMISYYGKQIKTVSTGW